MKKVSKGTLAPKAKNVSKNIANLNKAKCGTKMSKKG